MRTVPYIRKVGNIGRLAGLSAFTEMWENGEENDYEEMILWH